MFGGFQVGPFQPLPAYQQELGIVADAVLLGGKAKRKRRYTIVIDEQEFEVESYEKAVELLDRAKDAAPELAKATAKRIEKRVRRKGKAPATLDTPTISTPDTALAELVANYREQIRGIYIDAAQNAEIRALLRKKFDDEDEDDIEILLLH
jgi:lipopolysaccharide biosynthesis regulator YciM